MLAASEEECCCVCFRKFFFCYYYSIVDVCAHGLPFFLRTTTAGRPGADLLALSLVDGCVGGQVSNSKAGALPTVINENEKNPP